MTQSMQFIAEKFHSIDLFSLMNQLNYSSVVSSWKRSIKIEEDSTKRLIMFPTVYVWDEEDATLNCAFYSSFFSRRFSSTDQILLPV